MACKDRNTTEIKHGYIALVSESCSGLLFIHKDKMHHKTLANLLELRARMGRVITITIGDNPSFRVSGLRPHHYFPAAHEAFQPILAAIPSSSSSATTSPAGATAMSTSPATSLNL